MKMLIMVLLFVVVADAVAAEMDSKSGADRYIADEIEIQALPNGRTVTRLVSKNRVTARQYWVDSVYRSHGSIVVFQGKGGLAQGSDVVQSAPTKEPQMSRNDRVPSEMADLPR